MRVLTPVDQSQRDAIVLPYTERLATAFDASITILMAVPKSRALIPNVTRQAEAYVSALETGLRDQGHAVDGVVVRGDPASTIVRHAVQMGADLVVMTTRARAGLGKFILGSVAADVLANCATPVLILKEPVNASSAEDIDSKAAYLATIVWNRHAKGLYTPGQAEHELERLAGSGLSRDVLFATYEKHQRGGEVVTWLDLNFQLDTLRTFFPDESTALDADNAERRVS